MSDIDSYLAAYARLSNEERERGVRLIRAYNDAVFEAHPTNAGEIRPPLLFNWDEIKRLVEEYRADRLSNIGPAMERYLSLLDRGDRWPHLE